MRLYFSVLALAGLLLTATAAQAEPRSATDFQLGREYFALPSPPVLYGQDDGKIEVLLFFWYNCHTCFAVDKEVNAWAAKLPADVRFTSLPPTFNPTTTFHARILLTLRALGLGHEADQTVFDLFQVQHRPINQTEQLPALALALKVDEKKLIQTFNSLEVEAAMAHLTKIMTAYDLPGVPAIVIDGRYRFDIGTAQGLEGFLQLADILIEQERIVRRKSGGSATSQ